MPEPSITTPFLTTRSYGIVRSSHPGPMGHARRRRRIVLRWSGRREPGTAVGGLLEVRAGDVVAGAASPEPPWVACSRCAPAMLERGPRVRDRRGWPARGARRRRWSGGREARTALG